MTDKSTGSLEAGASGSDEHLIVSAGNQAQVISTSTVWLHVMSHFSSPCTNIILKKLGAWEREAARNRYQCRRTRMAGGRRGAEQS